MKTFRPKPWLRLAGVLLGLIASIAMLANLPWIYGVIAASCGAAVLGYYGWTRYQKIMTQVHPTPTTTSTVMDAVVDHHQQYKVSNCTVVQGDSKKAYIIPNFKPSTWTSEMITELERETLQESVKQQFSKIKILKPVQPKFHKKLSGRRPFNAAVKQFKFPTNLIVFN